MKKIYLILALLLSSPSYAMTYYECTGYMRKGVGDDFIMPFQFFLNKQSVEIDMGPFFGVDQDVTILIGISSDEQTKETNKYVVRMSSSQGNFDPKNPHFFNFLKGEAFDFTDTLPEHGTVRVRCNPTDWN